ncbi:hypothetical protein D3C75_1087240 [compost metagenome]
MATPVFSRIEGLRIKVIAQIPQISPLPILDQHIIPILHDIHEYVQTVRCSFQLRSGGGSGQNQACADFLFAGMLQIPYTCIADTYVIIFQKLLHPVHPGQPGLHPK